MNLSPHERFTTLLFLLALALARVSCAEPEGADDGRATATRNGDDPRRLPNVLMVVVDTLRADRVGRPLPPASADVPGRARGAMGEGGTQEASLTPFLDGLATRATTFRNAYTPTSWTSPGIASIFTSRYPLQHGVSRYDSQLAPSEVTLAERLSAAGYASAGLCANLHIQQRLGYAQGFGFWHTYLGTPETEIKPRAATLIDAALSWVSQRSAQGDGRPGFLYLQFMEPHSPYSPPEPHRSRVGLPASPAEVKVANDTLASYAFRNINDGDLALLRSLYDGEVAFFDAALSDLFARLEPTGFLEDAIVVVTADHGEEFREHEALLHGQTLFQPAVNVPLLIAAPRLGGGRVVSQSVSTLDVAATLLELLELEPDPNFEGQSLAPLMRGTDLAEERDVLLELAPRGGAKDRREHAFGIVRGSQKLLVEPSGEAAIYDLASDPGEQAPRAARDSAAGRALLEALALRRAELVGRAGPGAEPAVLDAKTRRRLRALGYAVEEPVAVEVEADAARDDARTTGAQSADGR